MIKLAKYLKPFLIGLIAAIVLLFGQAISDLSLPNYMSNIVNIGIQQNGIEHPAPDAISQSAMNLMTTVMTANEKQLLDENYELVSVTDKNAEGEIYKSLYPNAVAQIYVKKDIDEPVNLALDSTFETSTGTLMNLLLDMVDQHGQDSPGTASTVSSGIDLTQLYQAQLMLETLPETKIAAAHEKAINNETSLKQSGIMFAKAFYDELGMDISGMQTAYILRVGLLMLAIALLGGLATVLVSLLSSRIAAGVARNLRKDVFEKIESFSNVEFDKFSVSSLITRCTNDITQIQQLLMMGIRMICYAPIMGIGGIIMAVNKSVSMSWIIAVACIVLVGMIMIIMAIAMPKFKIIQSMVDKLNLVSRENLSGMMVIRAFGTKRHEKKRFEKANGDLTETNLFVNRVMVSLMPIMMLVMNGVTLIIVWVGAHQIASSSMQVGDMMAFMQYAIQIITAFLMLSMTFILVPRAAVSAGRIAEVLGTKNSIDEPQNPKYFNAAKKGHVEFKHVHFRYHGAEEDALSDITFTAKPGQTTAIIGSTGSGKSTIASLMLRFYDVSTGQIIIDGVDVREANLKELRSKFGYVPQRGVLLSGTIASNLRYGKKDATDAEVETAAKVAQALEFISEKPEGLESEIAQGGTNVSGGQKQRLSIGRALAKEPEIFIFDDSFSALDLKTDAALRKALKEHTGDSTVIVVAQRVSTIMNAEQIIVLDEGKIVGCGTHKELLKDCPQYYEIASSQLSGEELA
ncbi:ABC transporter ATP-binding protein/permease [Paenibacillus sp. N1-5-1-14]|uniref:ABC transporter ATP-binding protein n=1 Tax=Paenibacillus radicibacter TaxID=2972488 RepID=UPI0021593B8A|nr:ABC transporter ATP-binding protein [Paenibacillus radicibacter]MCR8645918.1 ABC transporter ATP-binding protein/permease [Paenibacillus radicibacter]